MRHRTRHADPRREHLSQGVKSYVSLASARNELQALRRRPLKCSEAEADANSLDPFSHPATPGRQASRQDSRRSFLQLKHIVPQYGNTTVLEYSGRANIDGQEAHGSYYIF